MTTAKPENTITPRISRRNFIIASIGAAVLGAAGWQAVNIEDSAKQLVVYLLKDKLSYLSLDEASLFTFAGDFLGQKSISLTVKAGATNVIIRWSRNLGFRHFDDMSDNLEHFQAELVKEFLLASDFFIKGAKEDQLVSYSTKTVRYPICQHPFARYQTESSV